MRTCCSKRVLVLDQAPGTVEAAVGERAACLA